MLPWQRHIRQLNHYKTNVCVVNLLAAIFGDREIKGCREKREWNRYQKLCSATLTMFQSMRAGNSSWMYVNESRRTCRVADCIWEELNITNVCNCKRATKQDLLPNCFGSYRLWLQEFGTGRSASPTRDQFTSEHFEWIYQESCYTKGAINRGYQLFNLIKSIFRSVIVWSWTK